MAYKLSVTELAHEDFSNIIFYVAVELSNKPTVVHFIGEVEKCYGRLKENPLIYEEYLHTFAYQGVGKEGCQFWCGQLVAGCLMPERITGKCRF